MGQRGDSFFLSRHKILILYADKGGIWAYKQMKGSWHWRGGEGAFVTTILHAEKGSGTGHFCMTTLHAIFMLLMAQGDS